MYCLGQNYIWTKLWVPSTENRNIGCNIASKDVIFFICYFLSARWPTLSHYEEDKFTNAILITAFYSIFDHRITGSLVTMSYELRQNDDTMKYEFTIQHGFIKAIIMLQYAIWIHRIKNCLTRYSVTSYFIRSKLRIF